MIEKPARGEIASQAVTRLGVLTPSSNTVLEPATMRLVQPLDGRLTVHFARFRVTEINDSDASDEQFALAPMLDAARLLGDAHVDAVLWAGTSGAWMGLDVDERLVTAIQETTGVPATTASLALVEALRALRIRRYALIVPYVQPIVSAIEQTLAHAGFACVGSEHDGLTVNTDFASVPVEVIAARARRLARARPDALVIHSTNLRGGEVADRLESELTMPVLDSVAVGLWGALQLLGLPAPVVGFGRLGAAPTPTQ